MTKAEIDALIDTIPTISVGPYENKNLRELSDHYRMAIESLDARKLLELTMSIYTKKRAVAQQKKKLGQTDERYMKAGEDLLFGELAAVLGIDPKEAPGYISLRLKAHNK